jgi:hypothetical protein
VPRKVFNDTVPRAFEEQLAGIKPPEGFSYLNLSQQPHS